MTPKMLNHINSLVTTNNQIPSNKSPAVGSFYEREFDILFWTVLNFRIYCSFNIYFEKPLPSLVIIFCRLNENLTTFLNTLTRKQKEKKSFLFKVYTKVVCY
jgi:hypothetical protein